MTIKVIDREDYFTIGDFHIELDTLEENGRTRYGAIVYEQKEDEEYKRHSVATPICTTQPEAISAGWVKLLEICGEVHDRKMSFVARKPQCGCIFAATVWSGRGDVFKDVKEWSKHGHISLVTVEEVRSGFEGWDCPHEAPLLKMMKK